MMRVARLSWTLRLLSAACALLVVGCGSGSAPGGAVIDYASVSNGAPSGRITVWSWNVAAKALQALTPAYERTHSGVSVDVNMTGANISTRLMLSLAAGVGAPDACQLLLTDAPRYIATGRLTDLTPVARKYRALFPESRWAGCMMNGRIYAIPWDMGPCAVFYKRDIFARYGIDPSQIQTWDDYIRAGQLIVKRSGGRTKMLPLGTPDIEIMMELLLQQTQGQVFDNRGRIAIDSPQAREALDLIQRMRSAGICSDVAAYSQEWMAGFNDDSVATYPNAFWLAGLIQDTAKDYAGKKPDWGVFRLPAVQPGGLRVANMGGSVLVILSSCTNKAAAWSFVEYALCTKSGQLAQYHSNDLYPSFLPALRSADMNKPDPFFGGQPVGRFFATDVDQIAHLNMTPDWTEAATYIQEDLSHWAATGMPQGDVLGGIARKLHRRLDAPIAPPDTSATTIALSRRVVKGSG